MLRMQFADNGFGRKVNIGWKRTPREIEIDNCKHTSTETQQYSTEGGWGSYWEREYCTCCGIPTTKWRQVY